MLHSKEDTDSSWPLPFIFHMQLVVSSSLYYRKDPSFYANERRRENSFAVKTCVTTFGRPSARIRGFAPDIVAILIKYQDRKAPLTYC